MQNVEPFSLIPIPIAIGTIGTKTDYTKLYRLGVPQV